MHHTSALGRLLGRYLSRSARAVAGLIICGLGSYLQIQAAVGLGPWNALSDGLSLRLPITFGVANIAISVLVILLDLLMREPIGLGTILNALVIGILGVPGLGMLLLVQWLFTS